MTNSDIGMGQTQFSHLKEKGIKTDFNLKDTFQALSFSEPENCS